MRVFCIYFKDEKLEQQKQKAYGQKLEKVFLESFAESCYSITPQLAVGDRWIFLEVSKCQKIQSEKRIYLKLRILLKKWQVNAEISLADDMPTALCQILFSKKNKKDFPIRAIEIYFQPFSISQQFKLITEKFQKLGLETFNDVFQIPKSTLVSRLGRSFAQALRHIEEADQLIWPQFVLKESITHSVMIDELSVVKDLEPLMFIVKSLLDPCFLRLKAQDLSLTHLQLKIEMEKYSFVEKPIREFIVEFPFPQNQTFSVLQILRTKLDFEFQQKPIESEIRFVEVFFLKTTQRSAGQTDLFCKKEENLESLHSFISKMLETLGKENVFYVNFTESYLPEKNWEKTLREPKGLKSPLAARPNRIFKRPVEVTIDHNRIFLGQKIYQILEKSRFEKIYCHWWENENERTYFDLITKEKIKFWIFEKDQKTYVHGFYD